MKKILAISAISIIAVGAYAQGTVNFSSRVGTTLIAHVFSPDTATPAVQFTGNTTSDSPAGTQVYTGVPIGGTSVGGPGTFSNGNRFTAQLWALTGANNPAVTLQAITQYTTTFRTSTTVLAGFFTPVTPASDPGIPNTSGGTATLQLRVWDNQGGTVNDWATAQTTVGEASGASPTFNLSGLGGLGSPPSSPPNMTGLQSFSLTQSVPEPSTIALGVMGAAAFLLRRRNK